MNSNFELDHSYLDSPLYKVEQAPATDFAREQYLPGRNIRGFGRVATEVMLDTSRTATATFGNFVGDLAARSFGIELPPQVQTPTIAREQLELAA